MAFARFLLGRRPALVVVALAMAALPGRTRADVATTTRDEPTAKDTEGAPPPGQESGRLDETTTPDPTSRKIGRAVLAIPRALVAITFAPVRAGVWFYERYQLGARWRRIFFNDAETLGLYPVLQLDSNYGLMFGARFVARDLFGKREHVSMRSGIGGRFRQRHELTIRSGERFGRRVAAELRAELDRRPKDRFFGIGDSPPMAVETRHGQDLERVSGLVGVRIASALHLQAAAAITDLDYSASTEDVSIETVYDPMTLTGFTDGIRHAYGELELRWDSRRAASRWDAPILPATGWLASVFAGRVHQLQAGDDYWRVGAALQHFIWLGRGPRILSLRATGEAVTGGYDDVSFTELPQLGGRVLLRGYPIDRFRDRVATVGTAEYSFDLNRNVMVSIFVDAGRVFPSIYDVTLDRLRVGYGIGLVAITDSDFIAEATLASSIDGGLFVNLVFDPAYDIDPRVVRR